MSGPASRKGLVVDDGRIVGASVDESVGSDEFSHLSVVTALSRLQKKIFLTALLPHSLAPPFSTIYSDDILFEVRVSMT